MEKEHDERPQNEAFCITIFLWQQMHRSMPADSMIPVHVKLATHIIDRYVHNKTGTNETVENQAAEKAQRLSCMKHSALEALPLRIQ